MHEIHLLKDLVADVLKFAQENNLKKVTTIYLKMGEFTEINPEILRFFFKEKTVNTPASEAEIKIETSPLRELRLVSLDGE